MLSRTFHVNNQAFVSVAQLDGYYTVLCHCLKKTYWQLIIIDGTKGLICGIPNFVIRKVDFVMYANYTQKTLSCA